MKTIYRVTINLRNRIEYRDFLTNDSFSAQTKLMEILPDAKILEVSALKPEPVVMYINNVIHVDFKAKKRVA